MTTFRRYYLYRLKRSAPVFAALAVLLAFLDISNLTSSRAASLSPYASFSFIRSVTNPISNDFYSVLLLSFVLPVAALAPLKSKRSADLLYALPLSIHKKYAAHLLAALTVYTALYLPFATLRIFTFPQIKSGAAFIGPMFLYTLISYLFGIGLMMISSFFFLFANTAFDGAVNIALWRFLPIPVWYFFSFIFRLLRIRTVFGSTEYDDIRFLFGNPLAYISNDFFGRLYPPYGGAAPSQIWVIAGPILFIVEVIAAGVLFFVLLPKYGGKKVGGLSTSWMSYKLLIPLTALGLLVSIIPIPLTLLLMLAGYVVYRRGFRFKKWDLICLGAALALSVAIMLIYRATIVYK